MAGWAPQIRRRLDRPFGSVRQEGSVDNRADLIKMDLGPEI
jgi:hypothetical protein